MSLGSPRYSCGRLLGAFNLGGSWATPDTLVAVLFGAFNHCCPWAPSETLVVVFLMPFILRVPATSRYSRGRVFVVFNLGGPQAIPHTFVADLF